MTKPTVFVGSSSEGLAFARAARTRLEEDAEVTLWDEGIFEPGRMTLDTLVERLSTFDFAVLVLTPDDLVTSRAIESLSPRDNVILELGLFMGELGRERTFILCDGSVRLPSDLSGLIVARYNWPRSDHNHLAAVGSACDRIRQRISMLGQLPRSSATSSPRFSFRVRKEDFYDDWGGLGWRFLDIRNLGLRAADVRVSVAHVGDAEGDPPDSWPKHIVFLPWEHTDAPETRIPPGASRSLKLANVSGLDYLSWEIPYISEDGQDGTITLTNTFAPGDENSYSAHYATLQIEADAEPAGGTRTLFISFEGPEITGFPPDSE